MSLINYSEETNRQMQGSIRVITIVVIASALILFLRTFYLQIWIGAKLEDFSDNNRLRKIELRAPRGYIVDANRKIMVDNTIDFDVSITPYYLRKSEVRHKVFTLLKTYMQDPDNTLLLTEEAVAKMPAFVSEKLKKQISRDELAFIETHSDELPGVSVDVEIKRIYQMKEIGAQLFGHLTQATKEDLQRDKEYTMGGLRGDLGLELQFESKLRGVDGQDFQEVDALGRLRPKEEALFPTIKSKDPIPGKNLILNIDSHLQEVAYKALGEYNGSVVAINPKTGAILAMVSKPSFDPTGFSRGINAKVYKDLIENPLKPFLNKTIQDHFPPGSTFKAISAITGLKLGLISPSTTVHCKGSFTFGNKVFHCWEKRGHGTVNLAQALERSCDVYFYKLATRTPIDEIQKYAKMLGLGQISGIDLPSEQPGLVPSEAWKQKLTNLPWFPGETLSVIIGQGSVRVTPLQLAFAYGGISHSGVRYQPQIVRKIEDPVDGSVQEKKPKQVQEKFIEDNIRDAVVEGLTNVVEEEHGTARGLKSAFYKLAGKTGTAQVIQLTAQNVYQTCEEKPFFHRHHGFFVGMSPPENAEIVVAVFVQHGCHSSNASKAAKKVFDAYFKVEDKKEPAKSVQVKEVNDDDIDT